MLFLKVIYDISTGDCKFLPIDGKEHRVCGGLGVSAIDMGDGSYAVEISTYEREDPNVKDSVMKCLKTMHTLKKGDNVSSSYSVSEWSYLEGCYYSHPTCRASLVDAKSVLDASSDGVLKATVYIAMGEYEKARESVLPYLSHNWYIYKEDRAHLIYAQMNEQGLGMEQNMLEAFKHYLIAESQADIVRFINMGYGAGVLDEDPEKVNWDFYHSLMLLDSIGEHDYAYKQMGCRASSWTYTREEKESAKPEDIARHKYTAFARLKACQWIMERGDEAPVHNEDFILYLGAYLNWQRVGHEDDCTYWSLTDERGMRSVLSAKISIRNAVEEGNELAIRGKAFIDAVEEKME